MSQNIVANFPLTFKSHLIFEHIVALPHFIGLFSAYGKSESAFEFGQWDREEPPIAEFAIHESEKQHFSAGIPAVKGDSEVVRDPSEMLDRFALNQKSFVD
jgi:hypothetical protein